MLIDREMNKNDLKEVTGLSAATIAKLGKGSNVTSNGGVENIVSY